jgi:hypothetical protein
MGLLPDVSHGLMTVSRQFAHIMGSLMGESGHCRGAEFLRGSAVTSTTAARLTSGGHQGLACRTAGVLIASASVSFSESDSMDT